MKTTIYAAEQEFKKTFPRLYQQQKVYDGKFSAAANKYSMMHQRLYPKHKSNPIICAHPDAHKNPKLIPLKKQMVKLGEIYDNYGKLIVKNQTLFIEKHGHKTYSMLFDKYRLAKYC